MRPQFHHIDAQVEQENQSRARDAATAALRSSEAKAVHMTAKTTVDGEEDTGENMTEKVTAVQQEAWTHHRYIDEDSAAAWETFSDNLFAGDATVENQQVMEQTSNLSSGFKDEELLDTISVTRDAAKVSRKKAINTEESRGKGKGREKHKEATAGGNENDASDVAGPPPGSDHENERRA